MKSKLLAIIVSGLIIALILLDFYFIGTPKIEKSPDFFVGVYAAYADSPTVYRLIDRVSPYTNLFGIGSTGISDNETLLNESCQYLYDEDFSFLIYSDKRFEYQWFEVAKNRWNDRFLGFYFWDENAGKQLDDPILKAVLEADNFTDAGDQFVNRLNRSLNFMNYTDSFNSSLFTSDYVLYWFDYKAGYDVVLAQLGWNYSRQLNLALCRGASTVQGKDWGVIVTWTYNHAPFIESGNELYNDLILAYENGAKYVLVFDSNEDYTESILLDEHFDALERFWQYTKDNPREKLVDGDRVAFVLPKGFGYGFRGPEDKIWGLWEADAFSLEISYHLGTFLEEYESDLDIIYDDGLELNNTYSRYIFWNGTIISGS